MDPGVTKLLSHEMDPGVTKLWSQEMDPGVTKLWSQEMDPGVTKLWDRNRNTHRCWYQTYINNDHLLNLCPYKWLRSSRLPIMAD